MKAEGVTSVASSLAANMPSLAPRPSSGDTLHELDSLHRQCHSTNTTPSTYTLIYLHYSYLHHRQISATGVRVDGCMQAMQGADILGGYIHITTYCVPT